MKDLANTVIMVPLLEKFLLVRRRVTFNEILQLREVRSEQDAAPHAGRRRRDKICNDQVEREERRETLKTAEAPIKADQ